MNLEETPSPEIENKFMVTVPNEDAIDNWFTYHPPTDGDIPKYKEIRNYGLEFAKAISRCCPLGADTSTAIRKVREAVMTANAAIACCGKP